MKLTSMTKTDSQYRITIPQNIREITDVDFEKEIRIYLYKKDNINYLLLSNDIALAFPCFGKINFDTKFRFFITKDLRKHLGITSNTRFLVYSLKSHLLIQML